MSCNDATCSDFLQKFDESVTITDSDGNDENLSAADIEEAAKKGREKYQEIRRERFTKYGEEITKNGESSRPEQEGYVFRVLSWNILSQLTMEWCMDLYSNSHKASLEWDYRIKHILSEIKDSNADIVTLQEVEEPSFFNRAKAELKALGYEGIFKNKTNDKPDGCALYYRTDNLTLKEFSFVEFYQPEVQLLDRDNIGIIARFEPKGFEGTEFIVATTHILYDPGRPDIQLAQTQLLLAEIERLAFSSAVKQENKFKPLYHPCILTGDFNLLPLTGVYNLVTQGKLHYDQLSFKSLSHLDSPSSSNILPKALLPPFLGITDNCQHDEVVSKRQLVRQSFEEEHRQILLFNSERRTGESNSDKTDFENKYGTGVLSHNLEFKSVYTHEKDGKPEVSTYQDRWITVDYIFYSPVSKNGKESNLQLISYQGLPSSEEAQDHIKALPNLFCGSDHLPLAASFFLAKS